MKHDQVKKNNLGPFLFPMSLFFVIRDFGQTNFAYALLVWLYVKGTTLRSYVWMPLRGPISWKCPLWRLVPFQVARTLWITARVIDEKSS